MIKTDPSHTVIVAVFAAISWEMLYRFIEDGNFFSAFIASAVGLVTTIYTIEDIVSWFEKLFRLLLAHYS